MKKREKEREGGREEDMKKREKERERGREGGREGGRELLCRTNYISEVIFIFEIFVKEHQVSLQKLISNIISINELIRYFQKPMKKLLLLAHRQCYIYIYIYIRFIFIISSLGEVRKQRRINGKGHRHEVNEGMDSYQ